MKNKNLVVTIGVVIVGAVLAWFGFGDKMVQQADKAEPQEVATTTPSQTSSQTPSTSAETNKAETADKPAAAAETEVKKEGDEKPSEVAKDDKSAETAPAAVADMKKAEKPASEDAGKVEASATEAETNKAEASTKSEEMAVGEKKPAEEVAAKASDAMAKSAEAKPEEKATDAAKSAEDALTTGAIVPSFDVVRVEPDGNTLVAGKAAPGSIVELMNGDNVLAKATADDSGAWVMILEEALRKGVHDLSLAAKAEEGADPVVSKSNIAVAIPESGELLVVESEPGQASKILAQIAKSQPKQEVAKVADDAAGKVAEMAEKPAESAAKVMEKAGEAVDTAKAMADKADDMAKKAMADAAASDKETAEKPMEMADKTSAEAEPKADTTEMAKKEPAKEEMAKEKPVEPIQASVSVKAIELEGDVLYVAGDAKPAGSVLRLYVDNRAISDSESSEAGTFLFDGPISLDVGSHDVRVDLLSGPDGKVLTRAQVSFEKKAPVVAKKDTPSNGSAAQNTGTNGQIANAVASDANDNAGPQVVNSRKVIIRRGDNLWEIARRVYGAGVRYSTIYDGNTEQIRDPHWIYPGQVFDLPEGEEGWEQNFDAVEAPSAEETNSQ